MINKQKKSKTFIVVLSLIIFAYIVSAVYGFFSSEYEKKPAVKEKLENNDVGYLYNFYISATPLLDNRPYYGSQDAPLTITVFSNVYCSACKTFISQRFPQIKEELINTGKARFYHKHYITAEDYLEKNENFIYANSLLCFLEMKPDSYWDFYFELHKAAKENISETASAFGVKKAEFEDCVENREFKTLREDMSETRNFGIGGMVPVIYVGIKGTDNTVFQGIPSEARFNRAILNKRIMLGD